MIKVSELWAEVQEIAQESPFYTYKRDDGGALCVYQLDGKPSCIVGQGLHRLGMTVETLELLDGGLGTPVNRIAIQLPEDIEVDSEADLSRLAIVQRNQDTRQSWGKAVRLAKDAR